MEHIDSDVKARVKAVRNGKKKNQEEKSLSAQMKQNSRKKDDGKTKPVAEQNKKADEFENYVEYKELGGNFFINSYCLNVHMEKPSCGIPT